VQRLWGGLNDSTEALRRTQRWRGGSGEDLTRAQRLQGGPDDGTGSGEVDGGTGCRENFDGKFSQLDGVSESLRGLGFAKAAQRFLYSGTKVAMGISDVNRAIVTKNHSSDGPLSSDRC
jgi:hypothetical protein